MAEADSRSPRIRLPKISLPTRRGTRKAPATTETRRSATAATVQAEESKTAESKTEESTTIAAAKAPGKEEAAKAGGATGQPPAPNMQERIEGLQGWMAEIERRQGRITYFGAAAVLIAILAAGAALYFGITAKSDSATKSDVDELSAKVDGLQQAVTKNTKDTQDTINNSISQLQRSISDLQNKQAQDAANISTLQSQAAAGAFNAKGGAAAPAAPGAAATPGTTTPGTTTTKKKP